MKNIFLIKVHSFIDVITNSSTELFVGNISKSLEEIKEICNDLIAVYNKTNNYNISFKDVFDEPYIIDENNIEDFLETIEGYNDHLPSHFDIEQKLNLKFKYPYYDHKEYNDKLEKIVDEKYQEEYNAIKPILKEKYLGNTVLKGTTDNSIPYIIIEFLEEIFGYGSRIHLG